jgi:hypothetical protein
MVFLLTGEDDTVADRTHRGSPERRAGGNDRNAEENEKNAGGNAEGNEREAEGKGRSAVRRLLVRLSAGFAVAMALVWSASGQPENPASQSPSTNPDHARLAAMCGTWNVEMTLWPKPGAAGLATKAVSTIRPLFAGLFVEERIEGTLGGASFTTLAWTGFNPSSRTYEATRIASSNPARISETGRYDDGAGEIRLEGDYALGGETWHQRTVIHQSSADAMVATSFLRFGQVPEWKAVEMRYARAVK